MDSLWTLAAAGSDSDYAKSLADAERHLEALRTEVRAVLGAPDRGSTASTASPSITQRVPRR